MYGFHVQSSVSLGWMLWFKKVLTRYFDKKNLKIEL
jgi:hypothetical protein